MTMKDLLVIIQKLLVLFTTILLREKVVQVKLNRMRKGKKQCVFILLVNSIFIKDPCIEQQNLIYPGKNIQNLTDATLNKLISLHLIYYHHLRIYASRFQLNNNNVIYIMY